MNRRASDHVAPSAVNKQGNENHAQPEQKQEPEKPEKPTRWWQWFLIYPGLAIAILGAAPTYLEVFKSYKLGVPWGRSFDAQEQYRLWQENFECAQKGAFSTTTNKKKVEIGTMICESGDVLLRGKRPEWERPQLRWVAWNDVAPTETKHALIELIGTAHAKDDEPILLAQMNVRVICQRWVGPAQLLQRIATPGGCFDQVINTYNGWVLGSQPAPCVPQC